MAERKVRPQVAKPSLRRRLIELGKDLLIAALACSAVFLAAQTSLLSELGLAPASQAPAPQIRQPQEAARPYALAVRNGRGLYAAAYDPTAVDAAFDALSPLLGQALAAARDAAAISQARWEALLERPGIYCAFEGSLPLALLSDWLGAGPSSLDGDAQALLLSQGTDGVWLCWREGERCFAAATAAPDGLSEALAEYNPNGSAFAYALARNDDAYRTLDPYVLIPMTIPQPQVYTVTAPDFTADRDALERLQAALGFQAGAAYESADGALAITEGTDRLRVTQAGDVTYHAREAGRWTVSAPDQAPTAAQAAEAAWQILGAVSEWAGQATYLLTGCEETSGGWTVTFQYRLGGIPVRALEDDWCARFTVQGGQITDFALRLHTFTDAGESTLLLPQRLAAAALDSLPGTGGRLALRYTDGGPGTLTAGWTAR